MHGLDLGLQMEDARIKASVSPGYRGSRSQDRARGQDADLGGERPDTILTLGESLKDAGGDLDKRTRPNKAFPLDSSQQVRHQRGRAGSGAWGRRDRGTAQMCSAQEQLGGQAGGLGWDGGHLRVSGLSPQQVHFF